MLNINLFEFKCGFQNHSSSVKIAECIGNVYLFKGLIKINVRNLFANMANENFFRDYLLFENRFHKR